MYISIDKYVHITLPTLGWSSCTFMSVASITSTLWSGGRALTWCMRDRVFNSQQGHTKDSKMALGTSLLSAQHLKVFKGI